MTGPTFTTEEDVFDIGRRANDSNATISSGLGTIPFGVYEMSR